MQNFTYWYTRRLRNAITAFKNEINKPVPFLKGEDFENYLRLHVFTNESFELVMRTHDYNANKDDYIESSLYPDFMFREKTTGTQFFVEAKYRENLYRNKLEWCKPYQFNRYKEVNRSTPTLIAIGFGGRPNNPDSLYLIPLKEIEYNALYLNSIKNYEVKVNKKGSIQSAVFGSFYSLA